jgi:N-acetylglutamate synthase-like GNAT family acetyltransferase
MLADLEVADCEAPQKLISPSRAITNGHRACEPVIKSRLTIRVARTSEAPAIVEFTNTVFHGKSHLSRALFASARDVEELMKHGKFLLAENGREIIGFAYLQPRFEASRLELLAVTPSQQRTGIGSQLLEAAERLSSSMQCLFMHLRVMNLHWETIRFCRRRGYMEFGIESLGGNQPLSLHCHFIRMCKRLNADFVTF